jgi:hypothetical protein
MRPVKGHVREMGPLDHVNMAATTSLSLGLLQVERFAPITKGRWPHETQGSTTNSMMSIADHKPGEWMAQKWLRNPSFKARNIAKDMRSMSGPEKPR